MKKPITYILLIVSTLSLMAQSDVIEAKVFEPGLISLPDTWDEYLSFSPDGTLIAFNRRGANLTYKGYRIYLTKKVNGKWTNPIAAPFSTSEFQDRAPSFSPDGNIMYFSSNRPINSDSSTPTRRMDLWYSEKKNDGGWSEPVWMGETINLPGETEGHPTVTKNGNLYFVRFGSRETDIYFSEKGDQAPVMLGSEINNEGPDSHPYIDPEERFLIYTPTGREDGYGGGDIYVSFKQQGAWTVSKNIGQPVNTEWYEYSAKVGPDGNLYFTRAGFGEPARKAADIYYVPLNDIKVKFK
ncbi:MAG: hypothetical protein ABJG47_14000 [Ekhidna sp.]